MPLTREDVISGFRHLLGREPESEETIAHHMRLGTLEDLRRTLVRSEEFASAYPAMLGNEKFEAAYKRARTRDTGRSGFKEADFGYVGLDQPEAEDDFGRLFDGLFAPRLSRNKDREPGFRRIFETLDAMRPPRPLIIETGCLRMPGNWEGDGQSTFLFDAYARLNGGLIISIDLNIDSIDTARRACSGHTQLIHNDSVMALSSLAALLEGQRVDLLYLDSFDLDLADPLPSATHHIMELAAVRPLVKRGTIVCVDDYRVDGIVGGKGAIVDKYMESVDARVLHDGYQKVWQIG